MTINSVTNKYISKVTAMFLTVLMVLPSPVIALARVNTPEPAKPATTTEIGSKPTETATTTRQTEEQATTTELGNKPLPATTTQLATTTETETEEEEATTTEQMGNKPTEPATTTNQTEEEEEPTRPATTTEPVEEETEPYLPDSPTGVGGVDSDNDGLIEIASQKQLNNIRYNLAGTSYKTHADDDSPTTGCPSTTTPSVVDSSITGCYGYELMADIDFLSSGSGTIFTYGRGWIPIGDKDEPFTAVFDGNDYTIKNLKIDNHKLDYAGLFGHINEGTVRKLTLKDFEINADDNVGGLVGLADNAIIKNVKLISDKNINGNKHTGGLIGKAINNTRVSDVFIAISTLGGIEGYEFVGGLIGQAHHTSIDRVGIISTVTGDEHVGGLIGRTRVKVSVNDSYTQGKVNANNESQRVGGFFGYVADDISVTNSYGVAEVLDKEGYDWYGTIRKGKEFNINNSYYSLYATRQTRYSEGRRTDAQLRLGLPTPADAQNPIFVGWDTNIWGFKNNDYPHLKENRDSFILGEPIGVTATPGDEYLKINWTAVPSATSYEIRWRINDLEQWTEAEVTTTQKTISDLINRISYKIQVRAKNEFGNGKYTTIYATPLDPNAPPGGTDQDSNGLFDIATLDQLNNIRHNLSGTSYKTSSTDTGDTTGCPDDGCHGYELINDLDFDYSQSDVNWVPIGTYHGRNSVQNDPFVATFEGNGYAIRNLFIDRGDTNYIGLFGHTNVAEIRNLALEDVDVTGGYEVGGLVGGAHNTTITNSYTTGDVSGDYFVGGLVGDAYNNITITNSYTTGDVSGGNHIGGLVGHTYNVTITNSSSTGDVSGGHIVGGLVGDATFTTITNSYATGDVSGEGQVAGGLVGGASYSTITDSYAAGNISGDIEIGGLVGTVFNTGVSNSYSTGNVSGDGYVGGLVGRASYYSTITDSYAAGNVSGDGYVGGLVGGASNITITSSYARGETGDSLVSSDSATITNSAVKTEAELKAGVPTTADADNPIYVGWGTVAWDYGTNDDYPELTYVPNEGGVDYDGDGLFDIANLTQLDNIRHNLAGTSYKTSSSATGTTTGCPSDGCFGYELISNLDFNGDDWNGDWTPIGDSTNPFTGTFDGNEYIISNLDINASTTDYVGLFGGTNGATIRNVSLTDVSVIGKDHVGGLAGQASSTTITNSYATGDVSGDNDIGGLVGRTHAGTVITNSYANGAVSGKNQIGGLIGGAGDSTTTDSYAKGDVSVLVGSYYNTGGLIGHINNSIVTKSYATGDVSGYASVGGLIGNMYNNATVTDSYATGDVSVDNWAGGGLVGYAHINITITNTYSSGVASGTSGVGVLIGYAATTTVTSSYAEGDTDDLISSINNTTITNSSIKTADELKAGVPTSATATDPIYVGWDEDIWDFGSTTTYPVFD